MKGSIQFTFFLCAALCASVVSAQVPGDGLPDVYYFDVDSGPVMTSIGEITRPVGTLTVDADGYDLIAIFIGGAEFGNPAASPPANQGVDVGCDLCDSELLPDPNSNFSGWSVGSIAGSMETQWSRTFPLDGPGYLGVIGSDPAGAFNQAMHGLANYGPGATFIPTYDDGSGEALFEVLLDDNQSGNQRFTNVTVVPPVPEPATSAMAILGALLLSVRRRMS